MGVLLSRFSRNSAETSDNKFGAFAGVFTPTILTILGAIMYLRLGWVVGNAGLFGALIIILLAHLITICTGLAVSSISTNTRVGAGGAFAIISQSLGLEIGGSVGVPLFLAQGISVALYVLAFTEGWIRVFADASFPYVEYLTHEWLVAIVIFLVVFAIAYISAQFAARIQFLIMAIIFISLISIFLGSFRFAGQEGLTYIPELWGDFDDGGYGFWGTFAIFFPAVTGIMSGISMSGSLRDPRRAIPIGTMSAIIVGMVIYVVLAYWLARVAHVGDLIGNTTIMVDKAFWGWAILAGMLGATLSSALGSLVAAPRVMQALATQGLLPYSQFFAQVTAKDEPRQATITTGIIALITLLIALAGGGLDAVASVITMFFLIAYAMLNVVVVIEQVLGMVSFRPPFRVPLIIPLLGMIGCVFVMFLVNPLFSLVAIVLVILIYAYLARLNLETDQEDVRSGLFASLAEWAVVKASQMPSAPERSWKPAVLIPVARTSELTGAYRFLVSLTLPQGAVFPMGIYTQETQHRLKDLNLIAEAFLKDGVYARASLLEEADFVNGVRTSTQVLRHTFFRPNILFLTLRPDSPLEQMQILIDKTAAYNMGILLLLRHPVVELGREQLINVWVSYQDSNWESDLKAGNLNLAILSALQIARNWNGQINLCVANNDGENQTDVEQFLRNLITLARLPGNTQQLVFANSFAQALEDAPRADLTIFGMPKPVNLQFCRKTFELVDGSCIFVRDSGEESALA